MLRAAQTHLAGHMRPAGRVFETPALRHGFHFWKYLSTKHERKNIVNYNGIENLYWTSHGGLILGL